jgi:hypothetical protein
MFQVAQKDSPFDLDNDVINHGIFPHADRRPSGTITDKDFNRLTMKLGRKIRFPAPKINNAIINTLGDR